MPLLADLYWSFRSPYSYILLPQIIKLRERYRISIELRVVLLAAIRNPSYFARMDPLARPYFLLDSARTAAFHGLVLRRPVPDPIDQDPTTLVIRDAQPLALRLSRLGIQRQNAAGLSSSRGRWPSCCGAERSGAGTRLAILPKPRAEPGLNSRSWNRR